VLDDLHRRHVTAMSRWRARSAREPLPGPAPARQYRAGAQRARALSSALFFIAYSASAFISYSSIAA
jgi:hypothetical protein